MAIVGAITNQLGAAIKSQSAARRIMLLAVALVSLGLLGWLIVHARTGGYTVLITNLRPADGIEAMAKLQQLNIKARMENGGTTIKVPQNRFDDAIMLLAMEGIPSSGTVGYEMMDKSSLGQSKFQQEKNYLRMREGELARTLLTIREIESAKVHLALPEATLFVQDEKPATASVVLKLHRGARLEDRQVTGIVNLVAHGIEGLKPEGVSVIDDMGNLLNPSHVNESNTLQANYKLQYEDLLKNRIETMLENVVGKGKVSARVQAEFNFATQHQIRQSYNPDEQDKIPKSEKTTTEGVLGKTQGIQGVPGSTSNLLMAAAGAPSQATSATQAGTSREDRTTEYAVSSTWEETQQEVPTPQRVSIAVLVDWVEDKDAAGKITPRTRTPEEMLALEDLVKAAIGFTQTDKREDQVMVRCDRFKSDTPADFKETFLNNPAVRQFIQLGVQWGIVGGIGLLLILAVLRPAVRQIVVTPAGRAALPPGGAGAMAMEGGSALSQIPFNVAAQLPPDVRAALASQPARAGSLPQTPENLEAEMEDIDISEIPQEIRDNQEAIRHYKLQRLAAKQARLTQAEAQKIHQEVVDTARANPQKTVSLLRQWMEEA